MLLLNQYDKLQTREDYHSITGKFFLDTIMGSNHFIRRSIVKFFICKQFLPKILHVTQLRAKQNLKKNARLFHIRENQLLSNWF